MTRDRLWTAATACALVALVAWSAWQRWTQLTVSPFPLGVDGYFYPVQLRALLETGSLQYPASPLTFWWMAPFAAATDPITGAKLGAAIGCALASLPAYGVARMLTGARGPGLLAAAIVAASATSAYVTIEFVKQGIGLTVALAALWLVLRALAVPSQRRIAVVVLALAATALTHKLAAAFVLVLAVPAAIEEARSRGALRGRRLLYSMIAASVLAIVVVMLGILAPQRFLSAADLALVRSLFGTYAHWGAPALATGNLTLAFRHEALVAGVLGIAAIVAIARRRGLESPRPQTRDAAGDAHTGSRDATPTRPATDATPASPATDATFASRATDTTPARRARAAGARGARVIAYGLAALGVAIALPWLDASDPQGLAFRLRVSAFVPLAIAGAIVAAAAASWIADARARIGALVALAILLVVRAPRDRSEGRVLPHPAMVAAVMAATTHIPTGTTVIVPERHILFMVAWYTRAPVALRPEPIPYAQRVRLLTLAFIGMGSPLDEALDAARHDPRVLEPPLGLHPRHRNGLVLVSEPTWDYLMSSLPAEIRGHWSRWPTI